MTVIRKIFLLAVLATLTAVSIGGGTLLAWRAVLHTAESRAEVISRPWVAPKPDRAVIAPRAARLLQSDRPARATLPEAPPAPAAPRARGAEPSLVRTYNDGVEIRRIGRPALRIGRDYRLPAGETVREVVVLSGTATIEGEVDGDMVVVAGRANLASTAVIRGDLVVIAGGLTVQSGADVRQDMVVVGSGFDAPPDFSAGGEHVIIGDSFIGTRVDSFVPWVTGGLFLGRPLVFGLGWIWWMVSIFLIIYLIIALVFDKPVRASADTLAKRPLGAFITGLMVLLLLGPVIFILAVSVVGIIVIPFVLCALVLAWLVGKVSVLRWIGASVVTQDDPDDKLQSVRSFVIGFVIITVIYLVPILGILTWGTISVWGLGTAALTLLTALRKENPNASRRRPVPPPPAPTVPPVPPSGEPTYQPATYSAVIAPGAAPLATEAAGPFTAEPQQSYGQASSGPSAGPGYVPGQPPAYPAAGSTYATSYSPSDLLSMPHAPFLQRAAAFGLDVVLVLFCTGFLAPRWFTRDGPEPFFFALLVYHVAFWATKASTVGGLICNLRVVRTDGAPLRLADAILRGLAGIFSLVVAGLGALWILRDPERQAWHDRIAGTYVVSVPRSYPIR